MNGINYILYSKKMNIVKAVFVFLLAQMFFTAPAQIPAPDILCVSKDTIIWDIPVVTCGDVEIYELYMSNDAAGPFDLLVVVVNPQQRKYYHQNSSGETRYYYMRTKADCPEIYSEPSDTINNIPPPQISISRVTVEGENARIEWEESTDDKVQGYVIYKATSSGTIPIDTVYNTSFYIDEDAAVNTKSEYYYVISMDECGNPSLFDITHRTIFAKASVDSCARAIELEWNPYEGWGAGLSEYRIYELDNQDEELVGVRDAQTTSFSIPDIIDQQRYCYVVKAYHEDGRFSASQHICLTPTIAIPVRYTSIYNATVDLSNQVSVSWEWNPDAQLSSARLHSFQGDSDIESGQFPVTTVPQINAEEMLVDTENNPSASAVKYYINSRDVCDTIFNSRKVSTLFFNAETQEDYSILMDWSGFEIVGAVEPEYFVERIINGQIVETIPVSGAIDEYSYVFDPNDLEIYESCYRLGVRYYYSCQSGRGERLTMFSNISCPSFEIKMQVPNAMVYQGVNDEFRPLFLTPQLIEEYTLEIFSRYGQLLYTSHDVMVGWDGTHKGQIMPQGGYVYKISARKQGHKKEVKGNFTLFH